MPVTFEGIQVRKTYTRPELAKMWGYDGFEAISRGVITPAGTPIIILFITHEKQRLLTQYEDVLSDDILKIEGETGHRTDVRLINAKASGDQIHLFYRDRHHMPFIYYGEIYLSGYEQIKGSPSRFRFALSREMAIALSGATTELDTHGEPDEDFAPDEEGRRHLRQSVVYERSRKNRAEALRIHGTLCAACGFDFNARYGKEFAQDFIEVHHCRSITEQEGTPINPATDLVPLCSNCHSMAHRKRGEIMSLAEIKQLLRLTALQVPPTILDDLILPSNSLVRGPAIRIMRI